METFDSILEKSIEEGEQKAEEARSVDSMKLLSQLSNKMRGLEEQLERELQAVETTKAQIEELSQRQIPDLMLHDLQMSKFTMIDGNEVSVSPEFQPSVTKDNQPAFFGWLRDNGHGDIIKRNVAVAFGKGQDNEATQLIDYTKSKGMTPSDKVSVHPQTLKAFVKEQQTKGNKLPETVTIYNFFKTKISLPRKKN